jgi:hypothetical protein
MRDQLLPVDGREDSLNINHRTHLLEAEDGEAKIPASFQPSGEGCQPWCE